MEIPEKSGERGYSGRRLVAGFLLLILTIPCFPVFSDQPYQSRQGVTIIDSIPLMKCPEIGSYRTKDLCSEPLIYVCFAPGFIIATVLFAVKRKKAGVVLLLFLIGSFLSMASDTGCDLARKARDAYEKKDYGKALSLFSMAEAEMGTIPSLCFNKALCFYRLEKTGHAINQLYIAIKKDPHDSALRDTLRIMERAEGLSSQYPPGPFIHSDIPFLGIIIFFNAACLCLGLVFRLKKGSIFIVFIFLTVIAAGFLVVFIISQVQANETIGIVSTHNGILKKIPREEAKPWIVLKEGTACRILDKAYGYIHVITGRGLKGWIRESDVVAD
ncbi:MAG: hypothetical protein JW881_10845 [Spirochaetales bacterium]|nr:hypothetical protein [Spirochaetales bacterium]